MATQITDGNNGIVGVSLNKRLNVSSRTGSRAYYVARDDGLCYTWTSSWSADTGEEVFYLKNNSKTLLLLVDEITCSSVNAGFFEIYTTTDTAAGTTVTGKATNQRIGISADASALGNAEVTGVTPAVADRIYLCRNAANGRSVINVKDELILGQDDAIVVTYTGSTGIQDIEVTGFFEHEDA